MRSTAGALVVLLWLGSPSSVVAQSPRGADAAGDSIGARVGLAVAGTLLTNIVCWTVNEYAQSNKDISRISPLSWKASTGSAEWDDNPFLNNQLAHPFQGNHYYNAARVNGAGFWMSALATTAGSLAWECCSERRPFSYNDPVTTILGGMALGEIFYRSSSALLGLGGRAERAGRGGMEGVYKTAASVVNPQRALARAVFGRWDKWDGPNDVPADWAYSIGVGTRFGPTAGLFVPFQLRLGSPLVGSARPYDWFTLRTQLNLGANIWGLLETQAVLRHLGVSPGKGASAVAFVHNFDYRVSRPHAVEGAPDTTSYQFGSQSLGVAGIAVYADSTVRVDLRGEVDMIFASLSSKYAHVTGLIPERWREYDYTIGGGIRVGGELELANALIVEARARGARLRTLNGSNQLRDTADVVRGSYDARHHLVNLELRGRSQLGKTLDRVFAISDRSWMRDLYVGVDWNLDIRDSAYTARDLATPPRANESSEASRFQLYASYVRSSGRSTGNR